jgi:hypothetical protein
VPDTPSDRNLPSGLSEALPLIIGVIAIAIPVVLVALAAVNESVVLLVLAVIAVFGVGAATLAFIFVLASDPPEQGNGDEVGSGQPR